MKTYQLIIKSHTNAPDFELTFDAKNLEEAIKMLLNKYDLSEEVIRSNICLTEVTNI